MLDVLFINLIKYLFYRVIIVTQFLTFEEDQNVSLKLS